MSHPYSTPDQVRVKLKDFIKKEVEDIVISQAIEEADGIIDAFLCRYYTVSELNSTQSIINSISFTIASSVIMGTLFNDFDQSASTWESKLMNQGKDKLYMIQDGTLKIPGLNRIFC